MDLPKVEIMGGPIDIANLEYLVREAIRVQQKVARNLLVEGSVVAWIRETSSAVHKFANTKHRVAYDEKFTNPLDSQDLLLGVTFTFKDKARSAMFKQAWGSGEGGLIKLNPGKRPRG
jgi:hypothetical protein